MLRNVSNATVNLQWGGVVVSLNPKDLCDVTTSFGATGNTIVALEDRFVGKFNGQIEKFVYTPEKEEITQPKPESKAETPIIKGRGRPKGRK